MTERTLSRRALLGAATAAVAGLSSLSSNAHATSVYKREKIRDIWRGRRGTTIWMDLDTSPFPHKNKPWGDPTTIVFVPHHFRVRGTYRVDTIVHFHGYRDTADDAMKRHQLREQLDDSRQNAILVIPQGPVRAEDPSFGKLDEPDGMLNFLTEVRKTLQSPRLQAQMKASGIPNVARIGKLILSAHSGGFAALTKCIQHGGYDIQEIYLFDALYGRTPVFADWLASDYHNNKGQLRRKLISFYADKPVIKANERLIRELGRRGVSTVNGLGEGAISKQAMTEERAIFIRSQSAHQRVSWSTNALRDCLYASSLERRLKSTWFQDRHAPRRIEHRK